MTPQYRTITYTAVTERAVWADVSRRGRLRFEGRDAASFLHALVTNDVAGLESGRGAYAAWLTPQGRMITDLRLLRDDTGVWAGVPEGLASGLQSRFDQLIFSEDVRVLDVTPETRASLVVGHRAAAVVAAATGADEALITGLPVWGHFEHAGVRIIRTDDTAFPTFELWTTSEMSSEAISPEIASELISGLRIEAGHPEFGVDMGTDTIPLEAGLLERAISQTKGCYVGQEVIVRILHRGGGKVVRHLVQLAFAPAVTEVPEAGAVLRHAGKDVGAITSAAISPGAGHVVALGYVHRDAAIVGETVHTPDGAAATIVDFAG